MLDHAVAINERFKVHAEVLRKSNVQFWAQHYPGDDLSEVGLDYPVLREQAEKLIALIQQEILVSIVKSASE